MINRLLLLFIAWQCCALNASEAPLLPQAEVSGVGRVKAKPDYVRLTFNVRSECYAKPSEAQDATDKIVAKIDEYLRSLKSLDDKYFKILINGGFTNQFSRWHQNKEYCRNTFQKNTEITLNIGLSHDFAALFSRIQDETLNLYHRDSTIGSFDKAQTFVSLSIPEPRVARINRTRLEREARNLALLDAQTNFKETVKSCAKQPYKIINIKEGQNYNYPLSQNRYSQSAVPLQSAQGSNIAPVHLDDLLITKELLITFQVEGTLCFENPS